MADGLNIVLVEVDHVSAVVVGVVSRPESRRAVVYPSGVERGRVEGIHSRTVRRGEGQVERGRRLALPDEEVNAARRSPTDGSFKLDFLYAERCERLPVEASARLEVVNRNREVVDEDLGF